MHIAQAAFELMAYTPSNKHFGLSNSQLILGGIVVLAIIVFWPKR